MLRNTRRNLGEDAQDESQGDPWVKIDKTVRGLDVDKVHDCKEDMDTLLVFAGLYSAVLTSLLVQSYQNLQENYQKTSAELLRHISLQTNSYTLHNGSLNSAAAPLHLRPFEAGATDIRVNVCWFASLILSLSAASFGMLVKQWLREYLAMDRTVPEERIRIHHFRTRGLEEWKLFEIAAALPLLLQLSLALFFVGLCLFTSEIHPSLRITSITLVSGWALLFILTFLAPLVSARCPYKTTFLRPVFRRLRPRLRPFISGYVEPFVESTKIMLEAGFTIVKRTFSHASTTPPMNSSQRDHDTQGRYDADINTQSLLQQLPKLIMDTIEKYALDEATDILEEDDARNTKGNDLVIFKNVDDILRDDHLLVMMRGALQRKPRKPKAVLTFVVSILRSRLGIIDGEDDAFDVLRKLQRLGPWTCLTFMNILCDALLEHHRKSYALSIPVEMMALVIVFSQEARSILKGEMDVFQQMLSDEHFSSQIIPRVIAPGETSGGTSDDWQRLVFVSMGDTFRMLDPSVLRLVVHRTYVDHSEDPTTDSNTYGCLLDQVEGAHPSASGRDKITFPVLKVLLDLTTSVVQHSIDKMSNPKRLDASSARQVKELLQFFLDATSIIQVQVGSHSFMTWYLPNKAQMDAVVEMFFTRPSLFSTLLECLGAHRGFTLYEAVSYIFQSPAQRAIESLSDNGKDEILLALLSYLEVMHKERSLLTIYKVLFMYWFILWFTHGTGRRDLRKRISVAVTTCLQRAPCLPTAPNNPAQANMEGGSSDEQHAVSSLAYHILRHINEHREDGMPSDDVDPFNPSNVPDLQYGDDEDIRYSRWKEAFNDNESEYSDELVSLLCDYSEMTTDFGHRPFWRVKRLGRGGHGRRGSIDSLSTLSLLEQASIVSGLDA